jgi:hypothetical protein
MESVGKKSVRSYVDESLYDQLREVAHVLNISMSKCISECLAQGLELMLAEAVGRDPKVISKSMKKYFEENNIKIPEKNKKK